MFQNLALLKAHSAEQAYVVKELPKTVRVRKTAREAWCYKLPFAKLCKLNANTHTLTLAIGMPDLPSEPIIIAIANKNFSI